MDNFCCSSSRKRITKPGGNIMNLSEKLSQKLESLDFVNLTNAETDAISGGDLAAQADQNQRDSMALMSKTSEQVTQLQMASLVRNTGSALS
jgi:hypothetical protein